jgi:hypothetical protein
MSEYQLAKETAAAQVLKAALLEQTDDPDALADTIEGATNLHEAIAAVMAAIDEDTLLHDGIDGMLTNLATRRARVEARMKRRRLAIERAMMAGELPKLELPQATLSIRRVPASLHIVSESLIPERFWVPQPPKLDKKDLAAALKAGQDIPGAALDNGSTTLAIRRA